MAPIQFRPKIYHRPPHKRSFLVLASFNALDTLACRHFHHEPPIEQQAKNERATEAYEFLDRAPALAASARNPAIPQQEHALSGHDTLSVDSKKPRVFHPFVSKKERNRAHFRVKSGLIGKAFFLRAKWPYRKSPYRRRTVVLVLGE